jgi:hypothetical protein
MICPLQLEVLNGVSDKTSERSVELLNDKEKLWRFQLLLYYMLLKLILGV